jgi:hypothetical protein
VGVFDLLVATSDGTLAHLVPDAIRQALGDPTVREALSLPPAQLTLLELIAATHVLTGQTGRDT